MVRPLPIRPPAPRPAARPRGFTLVELLVVIGIISVLIAILLPALNRARAQARKAQCLSNLRQIGHAFTMYHNENQGWFPYHTNWGNVVGKRGTQDYYDEGPGVFTGFAGEPGIVRERPLNVYLGNPEVLRCPDDTGDTYPRPGVPVDSCFEAYGTSYLVQFYLNAFAVMHVTSNGTAANGLRPPMRYGSSAGNGSNVRLDYSTKMVMGDWNWHANRPLSESRTVWHDRTGSGNPGLLGRRFCMLFADGHAEYFFFPEDYEQQPIAGSYDWDSATMPWGVMPDPNRGYW